MPDTLKQEIRLFYCYADQDEALRKGLEVQLSGLTHQYNISNWYDREITAGKVEEEAVDALLGQADIVLLLISPDFLASDYCYNKQMQHALLRHQAGLCCVIPILLRPVFWENSPFSNIQILPTGAQPVTLWSDRDSAYLDIVKGISGFIKTLLLAREAQAE